MADRAMPPVPDHDARMEAARAYARWHLGYPDWADNIINAYLDPAMARAEIEAQQAKYDTSVAAASSQEGES